MKIHISLERQACRPLTLLELEILNLKEKRLVYTCIYILIYSIRYNNQLYYFEVK